VVTGKGCQIHYGDNIRGLPMAVDKVRYIGELVAQCGGGYRSMPAALENPGEYDHAGSHRCRQAMRMILVLIQKTAPPRCLPSIPTRHQYRQSAPPHQGRARMASPKPTW
jgi:hypothetical protein